MEQCVVCSKPRLWSHTTQPWQALPKIPQNRCLLGLEVLTVVLSDVCVCVTSSPLMTHNSELQTICFHVLAIKQQCVVKIQQKLMSIFYPVLYACGKWRRKQPQPVPWSGWAPERAGTRVSRVVECLQMRHPADGPILNANINIKKEGIYEGCALNYPGTGVKFITSVTKKSWNLEHYEFCLSDEWCSTSTSNDQLETRTED